MDKDIRNEIDDEIKGIVYDDNDTDAKPEAGAAEDLKEGEAEQSEAQAEAPDEKAETPDDEQAQDESEDKESAEAETENAEDVHDSDKAFDDSGESAAVYQPQHVQPLHSRVRHAYSKLNKKTVMIAAAIVLVLAGLIAAYSMYDTQKKYDNLLNVDYFYEGIFIDDISLGGLTREQAEQKLAQANLERADKVQVELTWDEERIVFTKDEMDMSFDTDEILERAWQEGRSGEDKQRYEYVLGLIDNPVSFETQMKVDPSRIEAKVKAVALFKQRDPGEASVQFNPDPTMDGSEWFSYQEPQKGVSTDPDALWSTVRSEVEKNSFASVEIPREEVEPTTTIEELKNMTQLIVQFKTHMVSNSNREHNVRLASAMINGTVLMPGEIFSMNETTGKRTEAAGFKSANVIVGGNRLEPGIAGGVCQVSGTLFNAAVRADLEIVERHHHSFELSYLTRGRDATVNYGTADLRFKNTSDYPIYISMYTIDRDVYAEIYGMPLADGMEVKLYVKTTQTIRPGPTIYVADSSVPYGTTETYGARTGIKCTTYKDYYDADGKLIDRVELHRDYYRAFPEEVHYNPSSGMPR